MTRAKQNIRFFNQQKLWSDLFSGSAEITVTPNKRFRTMHTWLDLSTLITHDFTHDYNVTQFFIVAKPNLNWFLALKIFISTYVTI